MCTESVEERLRMYWDTKNAFVCCSKSLWTDFIFFRISAFGEEYRIACHFACRFIQFQVNCGKISWSVIDETKSFFCSFLFLEIKEILCSKMSKLKKRFSIPGDRLPIRTLQGFYWTRSLRKKTESVLFTYSTSRLRQCSKQRKNCTFCIYTCL